MVSRKDIEQANVRIRPEAAVTPLLPTKHEFDAWLKCEIFQPIGAFKIRGALNALRQVHESQLALGVVTESSGNHAQAVAYAAHKLETKAHIVMPNNSPQIKVKAVEKYGATICFCEPNEQARKEMCDRVQDETKATLIHPFNDDRVIAGQGTAGLEILEQLSNVSRIIVPIGGGGLISGVAIAIKNARSDIKIIGVEPVGAADALISKQQGKVTPLVGGGVSIAEGLLTTVGEKTFEIINRYVDEIVTVTEQEIAAATLHLFEKEKLVVEPSGATAFAAVMFERVKKNDPNTVILLTGGNIDTRRFPDLQALL